MAKNKKVKTPEVIEQDILNKIAQKDAADEYTGIPEPAKKKSLFATPGELEKQSREDSAVQAQMKADEKAKPDDLSIKEDEKFGEGARQMKKNVEDWKEDVAREKKEFEDVINKEEGTSASDIVAKGDELKDQINKQVGAIEGQVNAPAEAYSESNPQPISVTQDEIKTNENAEIAGEQPKALTHEQQYEKAKEDAANHSNANNVAESEPNIDPDFYKKYVDQYYGPKNGADYLKSLWSQGAGGKAAAIGNVLGNLMGAAGKGAIGQDYETDWQKYKDNYIKAQAERNKRAFDDNMDIVKQIRQNDVARNELVKTMDLMKKLGKITPQDFEAIKKGMAATGKSSQVDYYLASILGGLAGDKDFAEALKGMGTETINLLSGLAGITGNALGGINRFFGGGR